MYYELRSNFVYEFSRVILPELDADLARRRLVVKLSRHGSGLNNSSQFQIILETPK
jgi:hypothetical protein